MTREPSARERAFFGDGVEVVTPATPVELAEVVREAEASRRSVIPAGLGAHTFHPRGASNAVVVSTAAIAKIVAYDPDDFTVGVQSGLPLATLRNELARNGQELPVDLGAGARGTVGGLVARAPIGPRQHRNSPLSTLLLGAEGVRGGGVPFASGGRVVKNVAGYAVHKLLVGSAGRAGVIVHANFRLRPRPERREARFAAGTAEEVIRGGAALQASGLEPVVWILLGEAGTELRRAGLPVPAGDAALGWLFEGGRARVAGQAGHAERVVQECGLAPGEAAGDDDAVRVVDKCVALAEPEGAPEDEGALRACVLPSRTAEVATAAVRNVVDAGADAAVFADPFVGCVHVRWAAGNRAGVEAPLPALAELVRSHGGVARVLYVPPGVAAPVLLADDPNAALSARILGVFDPKGTFAETVS